MTGRRTGFSRIESRFLIVGLCAAMSLAAGALRGADEPEGSLAQYYGFDKLELFKLQQRSTNLQAADLNHDGRIDLILVDNSNSRLDLLVQRDPAAIRETVSAAGRKVNSIESDQRFEPR
jgi:hypothetical protein